MHFFDDLPPADSGIGGAEGNFPFLRAVGNDAHFRAAEIVIEQVLKPHAGDEECPLYVSCGWKNYEIRCQYSFGQGRLRSISEFGVEA